MTYEQAVKIGKEWKSGDKHRIYFNDAATKASIYGVDLKGKDGYINGEKISRNNLFKITSSRPYYDVVADKLCGLESSFSVCAGYASI